MVAGEWVPYPTGYEYAILAAARLKSLIKLIRGAWLIPKAQPFESFDEAITWMNAMHEKDFLQQQAEPGRSTVSFDLPTDKAEKLKLILRQNVSSQNQSSDERAGLPVRSDLYREKGLDGLFDVFNETLLDNVQIKHQPTKTLTLFPVDDYTEEFGVSWDVISGGNTATIFDYCNHGHIKSHVPEWDPNMLFSYVVLGRLPLLPLTQEVSTAGPGVFEHKLTIRYPMRDETLLRFYGIDRNKRNDSPLRHYNFDPPALSEYNLVLLELVHKMPLEDFTWPQRLEQYRKQYAMQIDLDFLPNLGLTEPRNMISDKKWNTAAGNFGRDYKDVLKKLK